MKKILLLISACALLSCALSCQKQPEAAVPAADAYAAVTLEATAPQSLVTRAAAATGLDDGSYLDCVTVLVFQNEGGERTYLDLPYSVQKKNDQFTIHLSLLKGQDPNGVRVYDVVILASSSSNSYFTLKADKDDLPTGVLTMDADIPLNTANTDFLWGYKQVTVDAKKGQIKNELTLVRPLAQVNLLATKPETESFSVSMAITGVPQSLDLFTGETTGDGTATFAKTTRIAAGTVLDAQDDDVKNTMWVASAYVLAPQAGPSNIRLDWEVTHGADTYNGSTVESKTQPTIQRGYRTNIITGNIFSNVPANLD